MTKTVEIGSRGWHEDNQLMLSYFLHNKLRTETYSSLSVSINKTNHLNKQKTEPLPIKMHSIQKNY